MSLIWEKRRARAPRGKKSLSARAWGSLGQYRPPKECSLHARSSFDFVPQRVTQRGGREKGKSAVRREVTGICGPVRKRSSKRWGHPLGV